MVVPDEHVAVLNRHSLPWQADDAVGKVSTVGATVGDDCPAVQRVWWTQGNDVHGLEDRPHGGTEHYRYGLGLRAEPVGKP